MMPNPNQGTSTPQFAWFHPGNYLAALRNGFNPIQATQMNFQGTLAIPSNEQPPNNIDGGREPTKPAKKPKTTSNVDGPSKEFRPKKPKKGSGISAKRGWKNLNFPSYEADMDSSEIPAPVCSCTGVPRQCYRWGAGGWQSSCCTTNVSEYPLPMSTTRPGSRMAGRKMSPAAFEKLLQKLTAEGYDFSLQIDLKYHWAKHGTNKFVTKK